MSLLKHPEGSIERYRIVGVGSKEINRMRSMGPLKAMVLVARTGLLNSRWRDRNLDF